MKQKIALNNAANKGTHSSSPNNPILAANTNTARKAAPSYIRYNTTYADVSHKDGGPSNFGANTKDRYPSPF